MAKIVILGGGLTGISTAYHLENNGFTDYIIYEKEAELGGLCRSVQQDGFTFDYTGHLLHTSDDYFKQLITDVVGLDNLHAINRKSFVYSQDRYTRYPYQMNLHGLPTSTIAECIEGFITRKKSLKKTTTFEQWVLKHFGAGFGKHFFFPFDTKKNAYNAKKLTTSWMGRFVPHTTLQAIIDGALHDSEPQAGYNARFFYPKSGGIQFWINELARHIPTSRVVTHKTATKIDAVQKVIHFSDGHVASYDILINTIPLDFLLQNLKEPAHSSLSQTHTKLLCNSVINYNLGVFRENLSDKHWIYVPEKKYPFYRIGFWHNFASSMVPQGCSSLYGEFAYLKQSQTNIEKLTQKSIAQTINILGIDRQEIVTQKINHISHGYVIYDSWREKNLSKLLRSLESLQIFSIGRYGEWKYSSMQEAVLDGKKMAETIINMPSYNAFYQNKSPLILKKDSV